MDSEEPNQKFFKLAKSKDEAKRRGDRMYFDGRRCKHGHLSPRYVSSGCVECAKASATANRGKQAEKRKQKTKENLQSIRRQCKQRNCDNWFTPRYRNDQVFCSQRCADLQGKYDYKDRNKDHVRAKENERRRRKYSSDVEYRQKQKDRANDAWHSMTDAEKLLKGREWRAAADVDKKREYFREYHRKRAEEDPTFKLAGALRARVRAAIKAAGGKKSKKTEELIGCTIEELMVHLERQFKDGMSWENYGDWHVDHIKPVASFSNLANDIDEQRACFHFSNLQPLWAEDNLRKGAKHEGSN